MLLQLNITISTAASPIEIIYILLNECSRGTLHTLQQLLRTRYLIIPEEKRQYLEAKLHTPYRLAHMLRNISNGRFYVLGDIGLDAIGISVIQDSQRSKAIVQNLQLLLSIWHPGRSNDQSQHMFSELSDSIISLPKQIQQEKTESSRLVLYQTFQHLFIQRHPLLKSLHIMHLMQERKEQFYSLGAKSRIRLQQLTSKQIAQKLSSLLFLLSSNLTSRKDLRRVYIDHQHEHLRMDESQQGLTAILLAGKQKLPDELISIGQQLRVGEQGLVERDG